MRPGVRLGIDVGTVRIGVARSDPEGILTIPVDTVQRRDDGTELDQIIAIAHQYNAMEVVVGLPRHLRGSEGISAKGARKYARRIARALPQARVCLVDERLSSNQAHARLRASGVRSEDHKAIVDQAAAQVILEQALEEEHISSTPPGLSL